LLFRIDVVCYFLVSHSGRARNLVDATDRLSGKRKELFVGRQRYLFWFTDVSGKLISKVPNFLEAVIAFASFKMGLGFCQSRRIFVEDFTNCGDFQQGERSMKISVGLYRL